jgi:glutamine amidotransferase
VLLPGVGAFDYGMARLSEPGFDEAVRSFAKSGRPLLGICLGMQLLLDGSEEGRSPGLGLIPGRSVRFDPSAGMRVPHMGWNAVTPARADSFISGVPDDNRFYFVHSYHVVPDDPASVLATSEYGNEFASMIRVDNVMGAQYHPEKSHAFGMTVLKNFATL